MAEREPWHLSKQVPIVFIGTIVIQTVAIVWWAASLSKQVDQHDRAITELVKKDENIERDSRRIAESIARIEERITSQMELLRRVESAINRSPR
jgi:peptidoglycan hydrolase CwlO-like protein